MQRITVQEVEHIAFNLARKMFSYNEPIPDFSTRYPNSLESCLMSPYQTWGRKDLYPTFIAKLSILFYLMNKNHPFVNGNKRIAMTTFLYGLYQHKKWIKVDTQELYNFAVWVVQSPPEAKEEVVKYIEKFIKKHIVNWRKK